MDIVGPPARRKISNVGFFKSYWHFIVALIRILEDNIRLKIDERRIEELMEEEALAA